MSWSEVRADIVVRRGGEMGWKKRGSKKTTMVGNGGKTMWEMAGRKLIRNGGKIHYLLIPMYYLVVRKILYALSAGRITIHSYQTSNPKPLQAPSSIQAHSFNGFHCFSFIQPVYLRTTNHDHCASWPFMPTIRLLQSSIYHLSLQAASCVWNRYVEYLQQAIKKLNDGDDSNRREPLSIQYSLDYYTLLLGYYLNNSSSQMDTTK